MLPGYTGEGAKKMQERRTLWEDGRWPYHERG